MTYHLVAIAPDGTRHVLSREQRDGWTRARSFADVTGDTPHHLSRKRAEREASDLNGWEEVRRRKFRIVAEPVPSTPDPGAPMTPATDPKYADCRKDRHSPDPMTLGMDGRDVTATCEICGALLSVSWPQWEGVYDESATCSECEEGAPFCSCKDGPR